MTRVLVAAHMEGNPSNDGSQWVFSVSNHKHGVTPSQMAAAYHRCNEIPTAPARSVCSDATLAEPLPKKGGYTMPICSMGLEYLSSWWFQPI